MAKRVRVTTTIIDDEKPRRRRLTNAEYNRNLALIGILVFIALVIADRLHLIH